MAGRPPTPKAKALAAGRDVINAGRYKDREEAGQDLPGLGDAPEWIKNTEECMALDAWNVFKNEAPWLRQSHRMVVAMASNVYGCMIAGTGLSVQEMTLFKGLLSSLGMTPSDASKVMTPAAPEKQKGSVTTPLKKR